jgi:hypothetical protein
VRAPRVTKEHHVDAGEGDADGYYDYYYAYHEYEIDFGDRRYGARVYDDETEVAFIHTAPSRRVADRNLTDLRLVLEVLRPRGVSEVRMLGRGGGYERVEL